MKIIAPLAVMFALLCASTNLLAKPTNFECHGLSYDWYVTLEVSGKTAMGTYRRDDNRIDTDGSHTSFGPNTSALLADYCAYIGGDGTEEGFYTLAKARTKASWPQNLSAKAANDWLRIQYGQQLYSEESAPAFAQVLLGQVMM